MYLSFLLLNTYITKAFCNTTQFSEQINVMDPKELGSASHGKQNKKKPPPKKTYLLKIFTKGYCFLSNKS